MFAWIRGSRDVPGRAAQMGFPIKCYTRLPAFNRFPLVEIIKSSGVPTQLARITKKSPGSNKIYHRSTYKCSIMKKPSHNKGKQTKSECWFCIKTQHHLNANRRVINSLTQSEYILNSELVRYMNWSKQINTRNKWSAIWTGLNVISNLNTIWINLIPFCLQFSVVPGHVPVYTMRL